MDSVRRAERDITRFWAKVDKNGPIPEHRPELGPCWLWLGALLHNGYGAFRLNGKQRRAHIVSFEWHVGPTNGLQVCHHCDVRRCVRPDHLFRGTQKANIEDAVSKARMATGGRNGMHAQGLTTLTDADVLEIDRLLREGVFQDDIARRFGVVQTMISNIAIGKAWGHVTGRQRRPTSSRPSAETIRAIRRDVALGIPKSDIATETGLSLAAVYRIANREVYPEIRD